MKKITLGIKQGKKVIYLKTKEVKDYFEVNRLIEVLEVFFEYNVERR